MNMLDAIKNGARSHAEEIAEAQAYRLRAIVEHDRLVRQLAMMVCGYTLDWDALEPETAQEIHRLADAEIERVTK